MSTWFKKQTVNIKNMMPKISLNAAGLTCSTHKEEAEGKDEELEKETEQPM